MTGATLVLGASGATGRLLVKELLQAGEEVVALVRSPEKLPTALKEHPGLSIVVGTPLDLSDDELARLVGGCNAVASCLGHNLSLKGILGHPRRLVTEATIRLCDAILAKASDSPTKFLLMNTAGNSNRDLSEPISSTHRAVISLIRLLLPPQADNEQAADHLRTVIGGNHSKIEWVVIRPDTLINSEMTTEYDLHPSPTRCAIFDPGKTSRINVAHFMSELIVKEETWNQWRGRMPVIYNRSN